MRTCGKILCARISGYALILAVACGSATAGSDLITGEVHNQTVNLPAAGDEVVLLRVEQAAQEEGRTRTDAQGRFAITCADSSQPHLLRVIHRAITYDVPVTRGGPISINVFDSASRVTNMGGTVEIIRAAVRGKSLHVSDMIEIQNHSYPPLTQVGDRTFEVYLPNSARIASIMAAGPENQGVLIHATRVGHEIGHYAVNFPLRPGSTKFSFNYDLPYDGRAVFQPRPTVPVQQLAVMFPVGLKFSSRSPAFHGLSTGNPNYDARTASQLPSGPGPVFEISGNLTSATHATHSAPAPGPSGGSLDKRPATTASVRSHLPPGPPLAKSTGRRYFVLAAVGSLLLVAVGLIWYGMRKRKKRALQELREEFFRLEVNRLRGSLSQSEYAASRRAWDEAFTQNLPKVG